MKPSTIYSSLKDRVVLITGGASGIGESFVEHFCAQGARVAFLDILKEAGHALVERLAPDGCAPLFIRCDVRDIEALRAAINLAAGTLGPITTLVNNAAQDDRHSIESVTPEYWDERLAVNLRHQFFAAQVVYAGMKAAGGGVILNLGSISWMLGHCGFPAYIATKAAVHGLTRSLAREFGPDNIRVNEICPGWVITARQAERWLDEAAQREIMLHQSLKEKLLPDDIAHMALFLASDDSRMCTGQQFIVDGGWT